MATEHRKPVAIPWYRQNQWDLLRAVAPDLDELAPSYAAWQKAASERIWELENRGLTVLRVDIDLHELLHWCEVKGLAPEASVRSRFAQEKLSAPPRESA